MVSPSATVLRSSPIAAWRPPLLGVLLTGLGVGLLVAGVGEVVVPARPARSAANATEAGETMPGRLIPTAQAGGESESGVGEVIPAAQESPRRPADCLGADLAASRRTESAHLATVPLPMPGECGDRSEALSVMATWDLAVHAIDEDPQPLDAVAADPVEADDIDFVAAALYGPPDRQSQPTLEVLLDQGSPDGGRGRARDYLEETATARWLVPLYRPLLVWDETSGYGAVEASRADR